MKIKVIFPPRNQPGTEDIEDKRREFSWNAPSEDVDAALEQAYREFNVIGENDPHIRRKCRSMSTGDVAVVRDGDEKRWFIVDMVGFKEVTEAEADEWMKLPIRDRLMGPKFLKT